MNSPHLMEWAVGLLALTVVLCFLVFEIIRPFQRQRRALRSLASKDFHTPILPPSLFFRNSTKDLRIIAELLQQLDRQITDDGLSLRAILSSMVEGVLITDRSLKIRLVNDAIQSLFSLPAAPVNRRVIEVFRQHELQTAVEETLKDGAPRHLELTVEKIIPTGFQTLHFDVHVAALTPDSRANPVAALIVFHDVTKVRNLEAMRREFLANVSHEFRTPLAIITGYLETLMDGAIDDPEMALHSVKVMHKNTRRLALLIDDLLTISRLEDKARLLELETADVHDVLRRVLDHLEPNILERQARVTVNWPQDARTAEVDARRMEDVFSNLLGNSLRYADGPQPTIEILARREGNELRIVFKDNGPGIPYDDQPHIFERFYRVQKARSRDSGGTGLGLSIVKSVIEAHGGTVCVKSTPGEGAAFEILLPFSQSQGTSARLAARA